MSETKTPKKKELVTSASKIKEANSGTVAMVSKKSAAKNIDPSVSDQHVKAQEAKSTDTVKIVKTTSIKKTAKKSTTLIAYGTGRKKTSIARVFIRSGNPSIIVNGQDPVSYFNNFIASQNCNLPFHVLGIENSYDILITVSGGGFASQSDAIKHGISVALAKISSEYRIALKKLGLLTVDTRIVERKLVGLRKSRKKEQFSKR